MNSSHAPTVITVGDLGGEQGAVRRWLAARPVVTDVLMALASAGLQALTLMLPGQRPIWACMVIALCSSAPLCWRRRAPFLVLCATVSVGAVGVWWGPDGAAALSVPFALALSTLAATRPFTWTVLGYTVGIGLPALGSLAMSLTRGEPFSPVLLDPFALIALSLGLAVKNREQRRDALAALVDQRLEHARMLERNRITAEMHDVVAHSISIMVALADGAATGWDRHPERSVVALRKLGGVGRTALTDMSRILRLIREDDAALAEALHHSGHNLPAMDDLVEVFRAAGLPVHLVRSGGAISEDPTLATTLYRITQEALTNALRYAESATRVEVRLDADPSTVTLTITDDGRSPASGAPSQGSGRGLQGIAERAAAYAGTSVSGRTPAGGWRTSVTLRIDDERSPGRS